MSSVFQNRGIYYLQVSDLKRSKTRSLKTKDKREAKRRAKALEPQLLQELNSPSEVEFLSFRKLIKIYLSADHDWTDGTRQHYESVLNNFNGTFPDNKATEQTHKIRINAVVNWGERNGYQTNQKKYSIKKAVARHRVFSEDEINIIITEFQPDKFRRFCEFAYQTGARSGEIRRLKPSNLKDGNLLVKGKTGWRTIILNKRATELIDWWDYCKENVSHRFKAQARKHLIGDARFHDLRRTFGYRLILNGMPIYQVSKLLGHKSVLTTERHYAPILPTDVGDFAL